MRFAAWCADFARKWENQLFRSERVDDITSGYQDSREQSDFFTVEGYCRAGADAVLPHAFVENWQSSVFFEYGDTQFPEF